jgi:hypothetical protein
MSNQKYIPALSFRWLTPLYDAIIEGPMSIAPMRKGLLAQMGDLSNNKVLDVGRVLDHVDHEKRGPPRSDC